MFLQNVIDKKLKKKNTEPTSPELITRTFSAESGKTRSLSTSGKLKIIGSIKNQKVNYPADQRFFHVNDIPHDAKQRKEIAKGLTDPDILGLKKKGWNQSTFAAEDDENDHNKNLFYVRVGLMDEVIVRPRTPKVETGVDTRNDYTGWNVSIAVDKRELKNNLIQDTMTMRERTKTATDNMLLTRETMKNASYQTPFQITKNYNEKLREEKLEEQQLRNKLREECRYENPRASDEKLEAMVFKKLYECKRAQNNIFERIQGKPNMSKTLKHQKKKSYYHTGKFTYSEIEKADTWSCCMNADAKSKGCNVVLIDTKKWNQTSYA